MSEKRSGLVSRGFAGLVLILIFVRELIKSSVAVARTAFARKIAVEPAIVAVPLDLKTDLGVAIVANLVSLTPGTTSLHTSEDGRTLFVHALDALDADAVVSDIKNSFEKWVLKMEGAA